MAKFSGRRVVLGIKKENVRGTAETTGFYGYPFLSADIADKTEKKKNETSYGNITKNNDEITVTKKSEGSYESKIFSNGVGFILSWLMGQSPTTTDVSGDTGAKQHVWELLNNNTHNSYTVDTNDPNQHIAFALSMIDTLKFTWVKDDFTKIEITTVGKDSVASTATVTFDTTETEFLPSQIFIGLADIGTSLDSATEADEIVSVTLEFKKNLSVAQTNKSKKQVSDINNTDFELTGSIEKYYVDTVYKGYDMNDTKKAMRIALIDTANLAGTTTPTKVIFDLQKVGFSNWKPGYGTSDISTETLDFEAFFNLAAGKTFTATLINKKASGTY